MTEILTPAFKRALEAEVQRLLENGRSRVGEANVDQLGANVLAAIRRRDTRGMGKGVAALSRAAKAILPRSEHGKIAQMEEMAWMGTGAQLTSAVNAVVRLAKANETAHQGRAEVQRLLLNGRLPVRASEQADPGALVRSAAQRLKDARDIAHDAADTLDLAGRRSENPAQGKALAQLSRDVRKTAQQLAQAANKAGRLN